MGTVFIIRFLKKFGVINFVFSATASPFRIGQFVFLIVRTVFQEAALLSARKNCFRQQLFQRRIRETLLALSIPIGDREMGQRKGGSGSWNRERTPDFG